MQGSRSFVGRTVACKAPLWRLTESFPIDYHTLRSAGKIMRGRADLKECVIRELRVQPTGMPEVPPRLHISREDFRSLLSSCRRRLLTTCITMKIFPTANLHCKSCNHIASHCDSRAVPFESAESWSRVQAAAKLCAPCAVDFGKSCFG